MIVNLFIHEIFGDEDQVLNSFFLHTTPRKFLFEGVKFCQHDTPAAELVCSIVRQEESSSIIDAYPEPGLLFSMFNHVSFIVWGLKLKLILCSAEKYNPRRALWGQHWHSKSPQAFANWKMEPAQNSRAVEYRRKWRAIILSTRQRYGLNHRWSFQRGWRRLLHLLKRHLPVSEWNSFVNNSFIKS